MIARLPKLPGLIAKTSRFFREKYPAYSIEQVVAEFRHKAWAGAEI
jgi:hypothetical protein